MRRFRQPPLDCLSNCSLRPIARALGICLLALLVGCARAGGQLVISGPTMGTTYTIKLTDAPEGVDGHVLRVAVEEVLSRIDAEMSGYRDDSQVARFNTSGSTGWFAVSPDVARVVATALLVSEQSQGAFDITVAPLVQAWGFGPAARPLDPPGDATLEKIRARVGHRHLQVRRDPPALRKDLPDLSIDLNAIAPGFAVDALAQRLAQMGVENFMIELGGEVQAHGRNDTGQPWRIAVERPVDREPSAYAIVQLDNRAVTTSGEYRHYYQHQGRRYSHTIDPRTAKPVAHALAAVVVIGSTSMEIDAWATAFNVLGAQAGLELAARRGMAALFIEQQDDGRLEARATPQFDEFVTWMQQDGGT